MAININIVEKGEVIASTSIELEKMNNDALSKQIKLLFESTSAEIKRRGSLSSVLQFNSKAINDLAKDLLRRNKGIVELQAVSSRNSYTNDPVAVYLQVSEKTSGKVENYKL